MWSIVLTSFFVICGIVLVLEAASDVNVTIEIGARDVKIAWLGLAVHVGERTIKLGKGNERSC